MPALNPCHDIVSVSDSSTLGNSSTHRHEVLLSTLEIPISSALRARKQGSSRGNGVSAPGSDVGSLSFESARVTILRSEGSVSAKCQVVGTDIIKRVAVILVDLDDTSSDFQI
jgi:hypothetical protein